MDHLNPSKNLYGNDTSDRCERPEVSPAVIRRLPRYFRYLRELIRRGKKRVSSREFANMMHITASQIRQDLNCFGGFGQQGYGYNVDYLYEKICELLGVEKGLNAIIIGAGDLGRALVRSSMFEKRGVNILAMFDVNPALVGQTFGDVKIFDMKDLANFCVSKPVDIAVLTLPKEAAEDVSKQLTEQGVTGIWNFTGKDIEHDASKIAVENVHLGDSLMYLNYRVCQLSEQNAIGKNRRKDGRK
jgi:redox-sensing transcriptional repressor